MLLLLTGTIDPSAYNNTNVVLTNADERLNQYVSTIKKYIELDFFNNVVFVENSGYPFPEEEIQKFAAEHNQKFELVRIKSDVTKTVEKGKSYGEGDCIDQGLRNSELIKSEKYFVKCTGRVFVKNIKKILRGPECNLFCFGDHWCYTVFFRLNVDDYFKYFASAKEMCNEKEYVGYKRCLDIETVFYRIISQNNVPFKVLKPYPNMVGVCGTNGNSYHEYYYTRKIGMALGIIGDIESVYFNFRTWLRENDLIKKLWLIFNKNI